MKILKTGGSDELEKIVNILEKWSKENPELVDILNKELPELIEIIPKIIENLSVEKPKIIKEWLVNAKGFLESCKLEFRAGRHEKALSHLYDASERLVKAHAMWLGLVTEGKVKLIGHKPQKAYLDLIKQPWIEPIVGVFKLNVDVSRSLNLLKTVSSNKNPRTRETLLELNKHIPIFLSLYNDIEVSVNKKLNEEDIKSLIAIAQKSRPKLDVQNLIWMSIDFAVLLLPISTALSVFYEALNYPDKKREIPINFDELALVKNMEKLIFLLGKYITRFEVMLER